MHKKTFMQIARRLFLLAAAAGTLLVLGILASHGRARRGVVHR